MSENKIWLSSPHMGGTEMSYMQEAYDSNWIAPLGPNVTAFEDRVVEGVIVRVNVHRYQAKAIPHLQHAQYS